MSKGVGVDAAAARTVSDALSEFKLPDVPEAERARMSREEWLAKYGDVLESEQWFETRDPDWPSNRSSWWYKSVGRDGPVEPLWMQKEYHLHELDCPASRDPQELPVDERPEAPMWAERMNLAGSRQGPQSATIYGHRKEYRPAEKTSARSMYERYQPGYGRVVNEELPDVSDPADGRFWKAGVAQGLTTHPYEKRLVVSARRKPIVVGPRSISVVVDGESHTLANTVRDFAWLHPAVEFSGYSCEHPVYRHVNLRVQTRKGAVSAAPAGAAEAAPACGEQVSGEQALAETLLLVREVFGVIGKEMERDLEGLPERQQQQQRQREEQEAERRRKEQERETLMQQWEAKGPPGKGQRGDASL